MSITPNGFGGLGLWLTVAGMVVQPLPAFGPEEGSTGSYQMAVLGAIGGPVVAREPSVGQAQRHTFTSGDHIITMDVRFFDRYVGKRLVFHNDTDPRKEICLVGNGESGACPDLFVGSVAVVTFTVKRAGGKLRGKTTIGNT